MNSLWTRPKLTFCFLCPVAAFSLRFLRLKICKTNSNSLWPNCEVDQYLLFAFYALLLLLVLVVHLRRQLFPRQFSPGPIVQLQNLFDKLRLVPFKIMDFFISGQNFSNIPFNIILQNKKEQTSVRMLLKWQTVDYRERIKFVRSILLEVWFSKYFQMLSKNIFKICDQFGLLTIKSTFQNGVNTCEIVINFFISAIKWHVIQQLSINLPEFTHYLWTDKTIHVNLCKWLRNRSQKEWPVKGIVNWSVAAWSVSWT